MKLNEFFTDRVEIEAWLNTMGIENYTIRDGGVVDVDGNVSIPRRGLTRIPIQFGRVTGYFNCADNELTAFNGCPSYVGGIFSCHQNLLTSLSGCPSYVGGDFYCSGNKLTSHTIGLILTGCQGLHAGWEAERHYVWPSIIKKYLGRPDDIFECQAELIENGFEEFAQL